MAYKQHDTLEKQIKATKEAILRLETIDEDTTLDAKLESDWKKLVEVKHKITATKKNLGVTGKEKVQHLMKDKYLQKHMNTQAVKI